MRSAPSITTSALAGLICLAAQCCGTAHAQQFGNTMGDYLLMRENAPVCVDQSLPPARRISSCSSIIEMAQHGEADAETGIATIYLGRALAYEQKGDDRAALDDFHAAVKSDRTDKRPWIALGNFYAARSDYSDALESYDRALKIDRDDPAIYDDRGTTLERLGRHDDAVADFSRAIVLDPGDTTAHSNRATAYLATNRPELAIADLSEVIGAEPDNGRALYERGTAYERSGQSEKAAEDYRSAVRALPSLAAAYEALGRLLKSADPHAAIAELSEAIRLDPHSPALRDRAILYLSSGQSALALRDLDQVIANDGSDSLAYLDRGVAYEKLDQLERARADYGRSIELAPSAAAYDDRASTFALQHQWEKARADFSAALALDPTNVIALVGRGDANRARNWLAASLQDYTRAIELDPKNAPLYFKRANVHFDLREFTAAYRDYSDSLALDPNQPVVLYNRSFAAEHLGRFKDAAQDRHRAFRLDPSVATASRSAAPDGASDAVQTISAPPRPTHARDLVPSH